VPHAYVIAFLTCADLNYADVLGHIVYVGKLQKFKKKSRHIQTCDAAIQNLR
jgi:23S rRNA A2030 N6-methylase RlmJ